MSNTEFSATNGENAAQNASSGQNGTQNTLNSTQSDNVAQENGTQENAAQNSASNDNSAEQKSIKLSEFLQSSVGAGLRQNDKGQFVPDNKQIKILVNCLDDSADTTNPQPISLSKIDTSKVTSMKNLFANSKRADFAGIEKWDTSRVTTFEGMFWNTTFNEDISEWNVSCGRNFQAMFGKAVKFDKAIGAKWDTQSATNMIAMFRFATSFNNGGAEFGEKWKMDKVEWTWEMFWGAENFNQPLNHWNMSSVTKCYTMFDGAKAFNQPLDKWDLSNAVNLASMFNRAESFNQNLSSWGERLGKARYMKRMFANTKSLTIDFLSAWKIPDNCDTENIIKGGALENKTSKGKQTQLANFIISEIKGEKIYTKFGENTEFLGAWLPQNIKEQFKIYLARYDENDELVSADKNSWEFAFCEVFESHKGESQSFLIEKMSENSGGLDENIVKKEERGFNIWQGRKIKDFEEFDEKKNECAYSKNELEIYFAPQEMWIINTAKFNNSESILSIVSAFVLLKAYKAKMRELDEKAKNYKNAKDLQQSHEELCKFDLHSYQSVPIVQNELETTLLLEVWRKMSEFYMVAPIHDELKETIFQISQLVSSQKQDKLNVIMRWVAVLSAIAAALAAVPVVQNLLN